MSSVSLTFISVAKIYHAYVSCLRGNRDAQVGTGTDANPLLSHVLCLLDLPVHEGIEM